MLLALVAMPTISAQSRQNTSAPSLVDSVSITFQQAKWDIDRSLGNNAAVLDGIHGRLTDVRNDSTYSLRHVTVFGGSSPDGSVEINDELSRRRAESLFNWFDNYNQLSDVDKSFILTGRDWAGTLRLAQQDPKLPFRDETLALLKTIVAEKEALNGKEPVGSLERMKSLRNGVPYFYMYQHIFPTLRESKLVVNYERILTPEVAEARAKEEEKVEEVVTAEEVVETSNVDTVVAQPVAPRPAKNFYMNLRTNMLYDALALPNIGVDFYLGKNFSIGANWLYGWWKTDRRHRYWRAYGGEINGRWWFGSLAHRKPLSGHHLGVYGQIYTYDFEWGGKGEMGGKPGDNMWNRCFWTAGAEYGFSLPVARRINIDFSLGVGYTTGTYYKYKPIEGHYVWQSTHKRHYVGPTKLEIALVWLLGHGNVNEKKGGNK